MKTKLKYILIIISTAILLCLTVFDFDVVEGTSMEPTIKNGSMAISTNHFSKIKEGDVIQFKIEDKYYIKRVVATHRDIVEIDNGRLTINGVEPENCLANLDDNDIYLSIAENEYYVLGDNRQQSYDSRDFGPITSDMVTGKVLLTLP